VGGVDVGAGGYECMMGGWTGGGGGGEGVGGVEVFVGGGGGGGVWEHVLLCK